MTRFDSQCWICDVQGTIEAKSSPSGSTTVVQQGALNPVQQPFVGDLYTNAQQHIGPDSGNTLHFPNFQTYAGPTDQQNQAIQEQTALANNDPITGASMGGIMPYLNGSMLSAGNPYFNNMVSQLGQSIAPSIDSHFNMNGRAGSGANNEAFASALANQAGQMAYQNYNDQSTNQLKAILEGGQVSNNAFNDIAALSQAGAQQQAFNQLPITQALQKFQFNQDAPFLQMQRYASLLGQPIAQGGTTTQPYFTNPVGSAIGTLGGAFGAANSGLSLYNSLFGSAAGGATASGGGATLIGAAGAS